ncbi:MAG TPA: hypothetical protein VJA27_02175 [Patescibacteria group bacterium]|nr:hypothetical protein [Patescibacteria group bacterium]
MLEEKIMTKLEEHDVKFEQVDKRLSNLEAGQNRLEAGQNKLEVGQDRLFQEVMEHKVKMENFVTKDEFHRFREEMLSGQDAMITILKRLDEERVFTQKWVKEVEEKVETALKDIQHMKIQLHIA